MLSDDERGTLKRIPDSVQALIAARIDGARRRPRSACSSTPRSSAACSGAARSTRSRRTSTSAARSTRLLEREFVTPEAHSSISGERAFQFTHGLIREVAYGTLTKAHRAEDHITLAAWVAERAPGRAGRRPRAPPRRRGQPAAGARAAPCRPTSPRRRGGDRRRRPARAAPRLVRRRAQPLPRARSSWSRR